MGRKIHYILTNYPRTRDNSNLLIYHFYKAFHPEAMTWLGNIKADGIAGAPSMSEIILGRNQIVI